jgi:hypothetical protein
MITDALSKRNIEELTLSHSKLSYKLRNHKKNFQNSHLKICISAVQCLEKWQISRQMARTGLYVSVAKPPSPKEHISFICMTEIQLDQANTFVQIAVSTNSRKQHPFNAHRIKVPCMDTLLLLRDKVCT